MVKKVGGYENELACFQYQGDVQRFYEASKKRLGKFNSEIAQEKTRIIEFGRYAERDIKKCGGGEKAGDLRLSWIHQLLWKKP